MTRVSHSPAWVQVRLRVPAAVLCLAAVLLAGCAGALRQVEREPAPDARLATQVQTALVEEWGPEAAAIFVEAEGGAVRLGGFADSAERRERAGSLAREVPGVVSVRNEIALR